MDGPSHCRTSQVPSRPDGKPVRRHKESTYHKEATRHCSEIRPKGLLHELTRRPSEWYLQPEKAPKAQFSCMPCRGICKS